MKFEWQLDKEKPEKKRLNRGLILIALGAFCISGTIILHQNMTIAALRRENNAPQSIEYNGRKYHIMTEKEKGNNDIILKNGEIYLADDIDISLFPYTQCPPINEE